MAKGELEELPVEIHRDEAGNVWATLQGASPQALLIGGHIDSVPNGGWLDGSLNILAGVEILRRINIQYSGNPPITVRLVDWADEEGARFGRSLFGSSACSGFLDKDEARSLKDRDGIPLVDALAEHGIDFERVKAAKNTATSPLTSSFISTGACPSIESAARDRRHIRR
jgi:N-carbamoyl-L-amino-acid hydrolase